MLVTQSKNASVHVFRQKTEPYAAAAAKIKRKPPQEKQPNLPIAFGASCDRRLSFVSRLILKHGHTTSVTAGGWLTFRYL